MSDEAEVSALLDQFRVNRREFVRRLLPIPPERRLIAPRPGQWNARDLVAHLAAWIEEANDRVPRLLAGAPSQTYDLEAFNAAAAARAQAWTPEMALAALRRAGDRFEAIISETDAADIADCEDAMDWLRGPAGAHIVAHFADIDQLVALGGAGDPPAPAPERPA